MNHSWIGDIESGQSTYTARNVNIKLNEAYTNAIFLFVTAERKTSLGKDWHGSCLRCEKCNKTLTPGSHSEHEGKPYCNHPCYSALFGPGGE